MTPQKAFTIKKETFAAQGAYSMEKSNPFYTPKKFDGKNTTMSSKSALSTNVTDSQKSNTRPATRMTPIQNHRANVKKLNVFN